MTLTACVQQDTASLLSRSQNWLKANPTLPEVKQALSAIVLKARKGELQSNDDTRNTADALTEYYVDNGGDLIELPGLDEAAPAACDALASPTRVAEPDYGSLYPDAPPCKPLSRDQKQAVITGLKSIIRRPEGM
jgi:hypothetical protein